MEARERAKEVAHETYAMLLRHFKENYSKPFSEEMLASFANSSSLPNSCDFDVFNPQKSVQRHAPSECGCDVYVNMFIPSFFTNLKTYYESKGEEGLPVICSVLERIVEPKCFSFSESAIPIAYPHLVHATDALSNLFLFLNSVEESHWERHPRLDELLKRFSLHIQSLELDNDEPFVVVPRVTKFFWTKWTKHALCAAQVIVLYENMRSYECHCKRVCDPRQTICFQDHHHSRVAMHAALFCQAKTENMKLILDVCCPPDSKNEYFGQVFEILAGYYGIRRLRRQLGIEVSPEVEEVFVRELISAADFMLMFEEQEDPRVQNERLFLRFKDLVFSDAALDYPVWKAWPDGMASMDVQLMFQAFSRSRVTAWGPHRAFCTNFGYRLEDLTLFTNVFVRLLCFYISQMKPDDVLFNDDFRMSLIIFFEYFMQEGLDVRWTSPMFRELLVRVNVKKLQPLIGELDELDTVQETSPAKRRKLGVN